MKFITYLHNKISVIILSFMIKKNIDKRTFFVIPFLIWVQIYNERKMKYSDIGTFITGTYKGSQELLRLLLAITLVVVLNRKLQWRV